MIALKSTSNESKNFCIESAYLGRWDYGRAEALQNELCARVLERNQFSIIGLEHNAVLTLGHRAQLQHEVLTNELPVVKSTRGGLATIHSEGQLVIYPIINLRALKWGVKDYVQILLETTQSLLKDFEIESQIDHETIGLHTTVGKIAFCGIQVRNGITMHGLSLNVKNDLDLFSSIKACGLANPKLDRMFNYQIDVTLNELFNEWSKLFLDRIRL